MRNLEILGLNNNGIEVIPPGTFAPLASIDSIFMNNNFLWELNSQQFGAGALENLRVLDVQRNLINIVDSSLITSATSLRYLMMEGNVCIDMNFSNVADYLWNVLEYLMQCTANFVQDSDISCAYGDLQPGFYICTLTSHNPRGFDGFASIPGNHTAGMNDSNVALVYSRLQDMRIISSAICRQFPNLLEIMIFESHIERITPAAFQHCRNIENVFINYGFIRTVPDNTFMNSPNLIYLSLMANRLTSLAPNSLRGSSIDFLDLSHNLISVFNPAPYEPINATLRVLDLLNNRLTTLPYAAFENINGENLKYFEDFYEYLRFFFEDQ